MASLVNVLKDEIRRLARKEIRQQTGSTAQAVARYRREIAQLKRQTRDLERRLSHLAKERSGGGDAAEEEEASDGTRFSARSVKAQRRRTGLSAADYARLVGVTPLTIYNWEHGKSRPRKEQFASLVALRGIGKREARAKLASLEDPSQNGASKDRPMRRRRAG